MKYHLSVILSILVFVGTLSCNNSSNTSQQLYETHCASCHMENGEGVANLVPSIQNLDVFQSDRKQVVCSIVFGIESTENLFVEGYSMPPNENLSLVEVTNILNYIRKKWYKEEATFTLEEVKKIVTSCNY